MTIEELNSAVRSGEIDELIRVCEARQRKRLAKIADEICARDGVRLVLLSGASSAGKTTSAKRLATQIRVNERVALHLSTDDYFVGDARNPRDENGELDYEHVDCVDIERLAADVNALMDGRVIRRRVFDFVRHEGYDSEDTVKLADGGVIVLEGIHALNPRLTEGIADDVKFGVFIEPRTQLEVFGPASLSPRGCRFLRRMVRDNQFRKLSPLDTLALWPKVLAGEARWINPFRGNADAEFDSGLLYELAVLKPYVKGLLELVKRAGRADALIENMISLLSVIDATDPNTVPGDSILRETIGGSQLVY